MNERVETALQNAISIPCLKNENLIPTDIGGELRPTAVQATQAWDALRELKETVEEMKNEQ